MNRKLESDAKRDVDAVAMQKLTGLCLLATPKAQDYDKTIMPSSDGVLFTTYAYLRGKPRSTRSQKKKPVDAKFKSRVDQLVDWLTQSGSVEVDQVRYHRLKQRCEEKPSAIHASKA